MKLSDQDLRGALRLTKPADSEVTISSQLSSMTDYMPIKDKGEGQAANEGDKEPVTESSV